MTPEIQELLNKIEKTYHPVSIFLYGSRARTDFLNRSDYEIGVLFKRDKKISRSELKNLNTIQGVNLYPFEYEDFLNYKIDTPFPETIYFRELIAGGKTIVGEQAIEKMKAPPIRIVDLLKRISFDMGFALAAILSHRRGDIVTASLGFAKSCLFGIRCLIILEKKEFPLTYDDIYDASLSLHLDKEYADVVTHAINVRKGLEPQELYLYKNISLLNKVVKTRIQSVFDKEGDITLLA